MCVGLAAKVVKVKGNIALVDAPGRLLLKSAPMTLKKQRNCWRIYNGGFGRSQTARYVI